LRTAAGDDTVSLSPGTFYTGVLEIYDRNVCFSIDGKEVVNAMTADQSATPKNHFVLAAYGSSVSYDDVGVWSATAP
jgi:hypothetical protein